MIMKMTTLSCQLLVTDKLSVMDAVHPIDEGVLLTRGVCLAAKPFFSAFCSLLPTCLSTRKEFSSLLTNSTQVHRTASYLLSSPMSQTFQYIVCACWR